MNLVEVRDVIFLLCMLKSQVCTETKRRSPYNDPFHLHLCVWVFMLTSLELVGNNVST